MTLESHLSNVTRRDWERTSPQGTVRVAVVGVGGFAAERAVPALSAARYADVAALVTGSPDRVRPLAEDVGADTVIDYETFRTGDHTDAYDAVYVATPNALHGEYAIAAARQGVHVICEKPLDVSTGRAREIVDACADADVTLMTAYRLQVEPLVRRARELVRADVIGRVVQVHGAFSNPLLEYATPDTWRLHGDLAGGGALVDLGIYPLNTTRFLLDADPVAVFATTHSSGDLFASVDEHVAFQLHFPGGATASCTASFSGAPDSSLRLIGTEGTISISSPFGGAVSQQLRVDRADLCLENTGEPTDEVREEFDYFGYCVLTDTTPEPDGADGIADLRVIEAAYESAATGKLVYVE